MNEHNTNQPIHLSGGSKHWAANSPIASKYLENKDNSKNIKQMNKYANILDSILPRKKPHNAELYAKETQLNEREKQLNEREKQVTIKEQVLKAAKTKDLEKILLKLIEDKKQAEELAAKTQAEIQQARKAITDLQQKTTQIDQLKSQNCSIQAELEDLQEENKRLKAEMYDKDKNIETLKKKLRDKQGDFGVNRGRILDL